MMTEHDKLVEIIQQAKREYSQDYTDRTEDDYIAEAVLDYIAEQEKLTREMLAGSGTYALLVPNKSKFACTPF